MSGLSLDGTGLAAVIPLAGGTFAPGVTITPSGLALTTALSFTLPATGLVLRGSGLAAAPVGINAAVISWAAAVVTNGGTVSTARAQLISAMIAGWTTAGVWDLIDDTGSLVAENAPQALTSLKQRRLGTVTAAPTFTTDRGYAFNGTTQFINTGFIPSTHAVAMTGSNMHLAAYERTNVTATTYAIGMLDGTNQNCRLIPRTAGNGVSGSLNSAAATYVGSLTDSRGLTVISRTAAPVFEVFRPAGLSAGTVVPASNATVLPTRAIYIGAYNNAGTAAAFRAATEGFWSVGASMTAAQQLAFYSGLQSFMTSVGANV